MHYEINTNGFNNSKREWKTIMGPKVPKGNFEFTIFLSKHEKKKCQYFTTIMIGILPTYFQNMTEMLDSNEIRELAGFAFGTGGEKISIYYDNDTIKLLKGKDSIIKEENIIRDHIFITLYGKYNETIELGLKIDKFDYGILSKIQTNCDDLSFGVSSGYYAIKTIFEIINKKINLTKLSKCTDIHFSFH